jgi:glycosyltransferase involved in cell wall biosynthesis
LVDNPHLSRWKLDALRRCDAFTSRWVTRFHAVSNTVRDSNCRHLGIAPTRVEVVPRGRTLERFEVPADEVALLRQNLTLGDADPLLLCVGRLIDQKGHRYLLQAMPEILRAFPEAKLLIAGEGWKRAELEATGRDLGIAPKVRFLGSRNDIPQLLAAADVFVFPSLFEGMPGALIEAMLAGRPIVASNIPQIQEVVTDCQTALLVPPREPAALSAAIVSLVRDRELRQRLAEAARNSARESYDIRNVTQAMENLYEEVMAEESRSCSLVTSH